MMNGAAAIPRADLLRHMQQVDADLRQGVRSPEAVSVYGSPSFVGDHVAFGATLKKYRQPTLGEMRAQCERDKVSLEARDARWAQNGVRYTMGSVLGGMGLLIGGGVVAASATAPLLVAAGVALVVGGAAAFAFGLWNVNGPNTYSKTREINSFEKHLDQWEKELSNPAVTLQPSAGPAAKVDPAQLTQMLSPEEKLRLAEQLLADVKAAQNRPIPTVDRQDGKVNINGIQVPVKRS